MSISTEQFPKVVSVPDLRVPVFLASVTMRTDGTRSPRTLRTGGTQSFWPPRGTLGTGGTQSIRPPGTPGTGVTQYFQPLGTLWTGGNQPSWPPGTP